MTHLHSPRILAGVAALAVLMAAACSDKEEPRPPAATPSPVATTAMPTPGRTAPATAVASPPRGTQPSTPPRDGTIDALGPGSTDPVTLKANPSTFTGQALLADVRTAKHELGDRIVFEFQDKALPPGKIEYVSSVSQCGSGQPVTVTGGAILLVTLTQAASHDSAGKATFGPLKVSGPGQVITEAVRTCDFEGTVSWAIGVTGKKNFKVTQLQDPARLVIDILK